jgi:hypothetical protein
MSKNDAIYDKLLQSIPIDPQRILRFKFPTAIQKRMKQLLELNRNGKLSEKQFAEAQRYLAADAMMRVLKAKALAAQRSK